MTPPLRIVLGYPKRVEGPQFRISGLGVRTVYNISVHFSNFFCTVMAVHTPGCVSALAGGCGKGLAGGVTGYAQHGAARSQIAIL